MLIHTTAASKIKTTVVNVLASFGCAYPYGEYFLEHKFGDTRFALYSTPRVTRICFFDEATKTWEKRTAMVNRSAAIKTMKRIIDRLGYGTSPDISVDTVLTQITAEYVRIICGKNV